MATIPFPKKGSGGTPRLPDVPSSLVRFGVLAALFVMVVASSFYTVEPEEIAVVQRFGAFDPERVQGPGFHFKLPLGIDQVRKVPVQRQLKQEFGFRTTGQSRDQRSQYQGVPDESNMLTGDLNAAVVEWVVQYRIGDPEQYLFRVRNVEDSFRDMSEAVMREVVGDRTVNEVLTVGRQQVADLVEQKLQKLADDYSSGIVVDQVVLQDVNPPERVKFSFNEVNQAQQEREQKINLAQASYNQEVPRAEGQGQQMIQEAEGYAVNRINRAQGEAARFSALYEEYRKAPQVTRQRLYLETLAEIVPRVGNKVVVDEDVTGLLPLLNLDRSAQRSSGGGGGGQP